MEQQWHEIKLSAKALGHLAQGLYRTPAGAIKELVSNAFDADAGQVRIHTDFPKFITFSCEDDGTGMSEGEFRRLMDGGIGNSQKRTVELTSRTAGGRPYIGRLGLGMLSLAEICSQFSIISHHRASKKAFIAHVKFPPYTREQIDEFIKASPEAVVPGGEYSVSEREFDESHVGVRINTESLRESFRTILTQSLTRYQKCIGPNGIPLPYDTFDEFLRAIYDEKVWRSLTVVSNYEQLLFGLALAPPLPFRSDNVVLNTSSVSARNMRINKYKFDVRVDNLILTHPVCLPSDKDHHAASECEILKPESVEFIVSDGPYEARHTAFRYPIDVASDDLLSYSIYELAYEEKVGGRMLQFGGYIFQQTGRLYPREIQGVLIRINDIAIGRYDSSLLSFPEGEGPRFAMVTGEIFIDIGFEDALNIDRDSFNELHPHYLRLQAYLHALLNQRIFPKTWQEEKARNKSRREQEQTTKQGSALETFSAQTKTSFDRLVVIQSPKKKDESPARASSNPVHFSPKTREITIDFNHELFESIPRRKALRPIVERVALAFERANRAETPEKRRGTFYRLLGELLKTL